MLFEIMENLNLHFIAVAEDPINNGPGIHVDDYVDRSRDNSQGDP